MLIIRSKSTEVYRNLAVEEWLLENAPRLPVLFLYVNDPCVVIGKNQNPWRECYLSLMEEEGVALARRISGGGAVYHDAGNLNVSVIVPRTEYVEQKQYDLIFQTLEATELRHRKLSKLGRNSLSIDGKKFSGNAFCHRRDRTLHHSTQLVNCDLARLGRYLSPELDGIETKAIASVPAEVANLPSLTIEKLSAALIETFQEMYDTERAVAESRDLGAPARVQFWTDENLPEAELIPMIGKNSSEAWTLEHTPRFNVSLHGEMFTVKKGRVINAEGNPSFEMQRIYAQHSK
jgi:lipoate-protein ligase A